MTLIIIITHKETKVHHWASTTARVAAKQSRLLKELQNLYPPDYTSNIKNRDHW